jgi:WbqC-like protein family
VKRVAISQSNYIPWKGYFDLLASVEEFLLYDEVQYTRRDWRNRNRIKTPAGPKWLTIPVQAKGNYHQRIDETLVSGEQWGADHWATIAHQYARTPYFDRYAPHLERLYSAPPGPRLSDVNRAFLEFGMRELEIDTLLGWSTDHVVADEYRAPGHDSSELLAALAHATGADVYVTGPAARAYLDDEPFARRGISVEYFDYGPYPEYDQPHPPFEHAVSVLDLLLCAGPDARNHLRARTSRSRAA